MCRHIYYWNIVACDVKQPISLTHAVIIASHWEKFRRPIWDLCYPTQARIQEFSSEGVKISENFDKPKKGGAEENGGLWWFFRFCRSVVKIDFPDNHLHTSLFSIGHGLLYNCKPLFSQTHRGHGSFDIVNMSGRVVEGPPPEKCCLNWCKIV